MNGQLSSAEFVFSRRVMFAILVALAVGVSACGSGTEDAGAPPPPPGAAATPPPGADLAPVPSDDAEGAMVASTATWDRTRNGVHVIMTFDPARNAFLGTAANTTQERLCGVQVAIVLEDGTALDPSPKLNLAVGDTAKVEVPAGGAKVQGWSARPQIAPCGFGG